MDENIVTSLFRSIARTFTPKEIKLADSSPVQGGSKDKFKEIGVKGEQMIKSQGLNLANSLISEEIRQDNLKITDYRRMFDNDGQVQMLVNAVFNTILAPGIAIVDDPEYEAEEDSEEKIFIEKNLLSPQWKGGMEMSMELTNRYALRAFIEGYRLFEIVYRLDPDGKIYLRKLAPRAGGDDFEMKVLVDDNGNFMGYKQRMSFGKKAVDVSVINDGGIKKVHRVAFGQEFGSLYGRSGLRAAWYHYDKAHKGLFLNHVGHELGVIKPRLIYTIGNTQETDRTNVLKAFDRIHMESSIMLPSESYKVEFPETTDSGVMSEGRETVNLHYSLMAKSILAQFVDLGSSVSNTGSRALGESQVDFFKQGLMAIAKTLIEDPWNEIVADLIKINFGSEVYPSLKVNPIEDATAELIYNMLLELTKGGNIPDVLKSRIITTGADKLGIEVSEEEIEAEAEEKKKEAEDMANQVQAQANMKASGEKEMMAKRDMAMKKEKETKTKTQKLSEVTHKRLDLGDGTEPVLIDPVVRPLYPDENKIKFSDIKMKLDDSRVRAEFILKNKLMTEKERIINAYTMALREGRQAVKKVEVDLAEGETTYKEELRELGSDIYEYGKRMAANEIGKSVPSTPKSEAVRIAEGTDIVAEEQEERLKLKLRSVANSALEGGIAENDAKLMLEQEYDSFWDKILIPTVGLLVSKMFNSGRKIAFEKNAQEIFAFRYTAVLDARTTQYCRDLDGKVFQAVDANYALLTPPNHYGCRSFWTPILQNESEGIEVEGKPFDMPVYSSVDTFKDVK